LLCRSRFRDTDRDRGDFRRLYCTDTGRAVSAVAGVFGVESGVESGGGGVLAAAATAFALPSGVCGRARRGERGERGGGSWLSPSALSAPPAAVPPAGRRGRAESWPVEAFAMCLLL
jgi:hypothetical protein